MSSANNETSTTSFPVWIPFICFFPLITMAKTSKTFSFSPLRIMFAVGLSHVAFIMLRYVPSMPIFWRVFFFYHKWVLNFFEILL